MNQLAVVRGVALLVSAWIETRLTCSTLLVLSVALLVSAWIETEHREQ